MTGLPRAGESPPIDPLEDVAHYGQLIVSVRLAVMQNRTHFLGAFVSAVLAVQLVACSGDSTSEVYAFSVTSANCDAVAIAASQFKAGDVSQGDEVVRLLQTIAPAATADLVQAHKNSETGGEDYKAAATQAAGRYNSRWASQCDGSLDIASFATGEAKPDPTPAPTDVDLVITVEDGLVFGEDEYSVAAGNRRIALQNNSSIGHDLTITGPAGAVMRATLLSGNGEYSVEQIDLPSGVYTIDCAVPGHTMVTASLVVE